MAVRVSKADAEYQSERPVRLTGSTKARAVSKTLGRGLGRRNAARRGQRSAHLVKLHRVFATGHDIGWAPNGSPKPRARDLLSCPLAF
jgi:hypothetical protein